MCSSCTDISCSRRSRKPFDMEICRRKDEIEISELDPFLAELLRQIPTSANPEGVPAAEQRLFSPPADPNEAEICAEWKLYVKPELRRLFQTATETVAADLEQLSGNEKTHVAYSVKTRRSMVERTQSGAAGHCREIQFHRRRAVRSLSLTDRIAAGLELVPGQLLWIPSGIHPARIGWLGTRLQIIKAVSVLAPSP